MVIRTLRESESLDSIWEELVFTESRLAGDDQAQEFTPTISQLIARLEEVRSGQLGAWREEVVAQAAVTAADDQLDDWIHSFEVTLTSLLAGDTQSPRRKRYFSSAPWTIIRLGLESEIGRVRGWADSLATEPEQVLKDLGTRLRQLIEQGDAVLERRRNAASSRTDHRVRSIASLVDDINGARLSLYGSLAKKAADLHLSSDWPSRFFRRTARTPKLEPQPTPPNPQPTGA
jgi:hypothetical protein